MDLNTLYHRTVECWADRVNAVTDDQWDAATPCRDWTVRGLVNHVVGEDLWTKPLVEGRTHPGHDPRAPLAVTLAVIPAVDRGSREAHAPERHVEQREASMSAGHAHTVPAPTELARPGRRATIP